MSEKRAKRLYEESFQAIDDGEPKRAVDLLLAAAEKYPKTWAVKNLVIWELINTAINNSLWDEAIEACEIGKRVRPDYGDFFSLGIQACRLHKQGQPIEATEVLLNRDTLTGESWRTLLHYGNEFAKLGAHDRAWGLYNEAATLAVVGGQSPHSIRQTMARLLLKEGKPDGAVEMLLVGISEAQKIKGKVPKSLLTDLRKALRAVGFNLRTEQFRGLADEIADVCKEEGRERAYELFQSRKAELEAPK